MVQKRGRFTPLRSTWRADTVEENTKRRQGDDWLTPGEVYWLTRKEERFMWRNESSDRRTAGRVSLNAVVMEKVYKVAKSNLCNHWKCLPYVDIYTLYHWTLCCSQLPWPWSDCRRCLSNNGAHSVTNCFPIYFTLDKMCTRVTFCCISLNDRRNQIMPFTVI